MGFVVSASPLKICGYLTYGAGVGLGAACAYVPTLAVVSGWFVRRRSLALGIAAAAKRLAEGPQELRQAYMKLLVEGVTVSHHEVRLEGSPAILEKLAQTASEDRRRIAF